MRAAAASPNAARGTGCTARTVHRHGGRSKPRDALLQQGRISYLLALQIRLYWWVECRYGIVAGGRREPGWRRQAGQAGQAARVPVPARGGARGGVVYPQRETGRSPVRSVRAVRAVRRAVHREGREGVLGLLGLLGCGQARRTQRAARRDAMGATAALPGSHASEQLVTCFPEPT